MSIGHDETGTPKNIIGTIHDISERKNMQLLLKMSEDSLRSFCESMTDIVWVCSQSGIILYTNHSAELILGYSNIELVGMEVINVHPEFVRDEARHIFSKMLAGQLMECPLPLQRKDGVLVPVETRIWHGQWNYKDCIFGISKNITKVVEAKQLFERIFQHNPTPMAISSLNDKRFVNVNAAFTTVTGYLKDEVIGKTSSELQLFTNVRTHAEVVDKLVCEKKIGNVKLEIRCKDGSTRFGLFFGDVISSQGSEFLLTTMIGID